MTMTKSVNWKQNLQYINFKYYEAGFDYDVDSSNHQTVYFNIIIIIQLQKGIGVYNGASALSSHTISGHTFIYLYHRVKAYHSVNSLGLQVIHFKLFYYFITTLLQGKLL